jgi:hypothetical protein
LIGVIVGSVLGGILLALAGLAALRFFRKRRVAAEKLDGSQQFEMNQGKILSDRGEWPPPGELDAETLSELPEERTEAAEMWAHPVELPTSPVARSPKNRW